MYTIYGMNVSTLYTFLYFCVRRISSRVGRTQNCCCCWAIVRLKWIFAHLKNVKYVRLVLECLGSVRACQPVCSLVRNEFIFRYYLIVATAASLMLLHCPPVPADDGNDGGHV